MRFGQTHGARPGAFDHLGQKFVLEFVRCVAVKGCIGAKGQTRIHAKGQVGRTDHFLDQCIDGFRRALTAIFRVTGNPGPATFGKGLVGFLETFGGCDDAVIPSAAFLVARPVDREQDFFADFRGLFENRIDHIRGKILATGHLVDIAVIKQLGQDEAHVAQGCFIFSHFLFPPGPVSFAAACRSAAYAQPGPWCLHYGPDA